MSGAQRFKGHNVSAIAAAAAAAVEYTSVPAAAAVGDVPDGGPYTAAQFAQCV